eukprot:scaffold742_cov395-Prasinococcus_capsulatus_cf.AAC.3
MRKLESGFRLVHGHGHVSPFESSLTAVSVAALPSAPTTLNCNAIERLFRPHHLVASLSLNRLRLVTNINKCIPGRR